MGVAKESHRRRSSNFRPLALSSTYFAASFAPAPEHPQGGVGWAAGAVAYENYGNYAHSDDRCRCHQHYCSAYCDLSKLLVDGDELFATKWSRGWMNC